MPKTPSGISRMAPLCKDCVFWQQSKEKRECLTCKQILDNKMVKKHFILRGQPCK